jgi:hypothetical protein
MTQEAVSFVTRCHHFFGLRPGESISSFESEIVALTEQDQRELTEMFNSDGMPTMPPLAKAQNQATTNTMA